MKRSRKIEGMLMQEASDFWDAHDFTEFEDVEEVKDMRIVLKKRKYIHSRSEYFFHKDHQSQE